MKINIKTLTYLLLIITLTFLSGYLISLLINREVTVKNIDVNNTIAVVNSDLGIYDSEDTYINFANFYIGEMQDDEDYKFVTVSLSEAESGIKSDLYSALIEFPTDFSQNIMSIETDKPYNSFLNYKLNKSLDDSRYELMDKVIKLEIADIDNDVNYLYTTNYYNTLNSTKDQVDLIDDVKEDTDQKIADHEDTLNVSLKTYQTAITKEQAEYNKSLNENYATVEIKTADPYTIGTDSELNNEVKLDNETLETEYQITLDDETLSRQGKASLDVFLDYQVNEYDKIDSSAVDPNNRIYIDYKCSNSENDCSTNNYYLNKANEIDSELNTNYSIYDKEYFDTVYSSTKLDFDTLNPDYDFLCTPEKYVDPEDPSLGCAKWRYSEPINYSRNYVMYRIKVDNYLPDVSEEQIITDLLEYYETENQPMTDNLLYMYAKFLNNEYSTRTYINNQINASSCYNNQSSINCHIKTTLDLIYHNNTYSYYNDPEENIDHLYTTDLSWDIVNNEITNQTRTNNSELSKMLREEQQSIDKQVDENYQTNQNIIETQVNEDIAAINENTNSYNDYMKNTFGGNNCPACIKLYSPKETTELEENYGLLLTEYSTDNTVLNEEYNDTLLPFYNLNSQYNVNGVLNQSHIDLVANPVKGVELENSNNPLTYTLGKLSDNELFLLAIILFTLLMFIIFYILGVKNDKSDNGVRK